MGLANFGELKTAIADLLNRDDLTSAIPDFVTLLERRVNTEIKFRNRLMEATTTLAYSSTDEATLPTDFLEARTVVWLSNPRVRLEYMTPTQFEDAYTTDTAATPINYTIYGTTLKIGPFPNSTVGVSLLYYQKLTELSADGDTNWLLDNHPDVYLYGSAIASAPYLGDDQRLQTWIGLYDRAAGRVAGDDARARWNGAPRVPALDVRSIV